MTTRQSSEVPYPRAPPNSNDPEYVIRFTEWVHRYWNNYWIPTSRWPQVARNLVFTPLRSDSQNDQLYMFLVGNGFDPVIAHEYILAGIDPARRTRHTIQQNALHARTMRRDPNLQYMRYVTMDDLRENARGIRGMDNFLVRIRELPF